MADIQIEAAAGTFNWTKSLRGGIFWTADTDGGVGYIIYLNGTYDLVYRKTADGGATWGAAQVVVAAAACDAVKYDCWADWQTDGDAGTKIHIVYMSMDTEEVRYVYLDTDGDSVGGDDLVETCQGSATFKNVQGIDAHQVSITKTRGGNLVIAGKYLDTLSAAFSYCYTSPDADTWTSKDSPFDDSVDHCLLFPGNETDDQDVWGVYWDVSANDILLKTFDDDGDSWSAGTAINADMVATSSYFQMDGAIRFSDGHLILAAWNLYDNALADLMTWDINGEGSITAKTDVLTNSAESFLVTVFINQNGDDIYVTYARGTAVGSLTKVFYQLSENGGGAWGGEEAMQADAEEDMRWISCGAVKAAWGGKFQPVWFNDDLNDLFCNTDNGISIAAAVAGTVVTPATIALSDTQYIPILKETTTPTTLSITDTQFIPILKEVTTPSTIALTATGYAPPFLFVTHIAVLLAIPERATSLALYNRDASLALYDRDVNITMYDHDVAASLPSKTGNLKMRTK